MEKALWRPRPKFDRGNPNHSNRSDEVENERKRGEVEKYINQLSVIKSRYGGQKERKKNISGKQ